MKLLLKTVKFKMTTETKKVEELSVTEYAESVGLGRQAVLNQIWTKRLPDGVTVKKVGKTWVISREK